LEDASRHHCGQQAPVGPPKLILKQPELVQEVPLSLQIQTFQRLRSLETNHRDLRLGKWVLLGSLGLFILVAIALPNTFGTFKTRDLVTLLGVLFLHEAGHFLAMKAFGYRDTKMFFLPLFGAAVTGRKVDASLSEKVWVLLAGPLPGLLLGLGLMAGIHAHPAARGWESSAWMLITLNLLNLLPIYPLDGGKIAHHLVFSRYPWTDVVFKVFTVLLFGLCSFLSPSLLVLAIATGLSIPNSYRTAKLNLTIQQGLAGEHASSDALLTLVFQQMGSAGYGQLPLAKRDAIAKDLIDRQRESQAPLLSRLGLAGIYALSLVGGFSGTVMAVIPQAREAIRSNQTASASGLDNRSLQRANRLIQQQPRSAAGYSQRAAIYQQRFASRAAALATPVSQRLTAGTSIHPDHPGYGDLTKALADYDMAIQLEPEHPELYQTRAQLKRLMGKPASAIVDYQALIQRDDQNPLLYLDRAELLQSLGHHREAIDDTSQSIKLKTDNPQAYELRSQSKQALGDLAGAIRDQQQADRLSRQMATTEGA
jgi:tetratricopeptide (TPR) repeat protein